MIALVRGSSMATISSISSALSTGAPGSQDFRLRQAKRDAERAEQNARSLQAQASDANQEANQAIDYARSIASEADRAQADAGQARRGVAVIQAAARSQPADVVSQTTEILKAAESARFGAGVAAPVINAAGQLTGTVVNTTA